MKYTYIPSKRLGEDFWTAYFVLLENQPSQLRFRRGIFLNAVQNTVGFQAHDNNFSCR